MIITGYDYSEWRKYRINNGIIEYSYNSVWYVSRKQTLDHVAWRPILQEYFDKILSQL